MNPTHTTHLLSLIQNGNLRLVLARKALMTMSEWFRRRDDKWSEDVRWCYAIFNECLIHGTDNTNTQWTLIEPTWIEWRKVQVFLRSKRIIRWIESCYWCMIVWCSDRNHIFVIDLSRSGIAQTVQRTSFETSPKSDIILNPIFGVFIT